jgi:hypothetical protein
MIVESKILGEKLTWKHFIAAFLIANQPTWSSDVGEAIKARDKTADMSDMFAMMDWYMPALKIR